MYEVWQRYKKHGGKGRYGIIIIAGIE